MGGTAQREEDVDSPIRRIKQGGQNQNREKINPQRPKEGGTKNTLFWGDEINRRQEGPMLNGEVKMVVLHRGSGD